MSGATDPETVLKHFNPMQIFSRGKDPSTAISRREIRWVMNDMAKSQRHLVTRTNSPNRVWNIWARNSLVIDSLSFQNVNPKGYLIEKFTLLLPLLHIFKLLFLCVVRVMPAFIPAWHFQATNFQCVHPGLDTLHRDSLRFIEVSVIPNRPQPTLHGKVIEWTLLLKKRPLVV